MNNVIEKRLFQVEVRESKSCTTWEVDVIATSTRDARKVGINALEKKGLINRRHIAKTSVYESGTTVWVGV